MRSCIPVFYIALILSQAVTHAQADPDALYRNRATLANARSAATIWESRLEGGPAQLRRGLEAGTGLATGSDRMSYPTPGARRSSGASKRGGWRQPSSPSGPKDTSGWPPTWARSPNRSGCGRGSSIAARSRTNWKRCSARPGISTRFGGPRPGTLVLPRSGPLWREQQEVRRPPQKVAHIRREQHCVALLPRRDAVRARSRSRSHRGTEEGHRGTVRCGVGA